MLEEIVSGRADQEHRSGQRFVEELEQVEERRLGPVQVLEHDHERAVCGKCGEESRHGIERFVSAQQAWADGR